MAMFTASVHVVRIVKVRALMYRRAKQVSDTEKENHAQNQPEKQRNQVNQQSTRTSKTLGKCIWKYSRHKE